MSLQAGLARFFADAVTLGAFAAFDDHERERNDILSIALDARGGWIEALKQECLRRKEKSPDSSIART